MLTIRDPNGITYVNALDLDDKLKFVDRDTFVQNPTTKANNERSRYQSSGMQIPGYRISKAQYDGFIPHNNTTYVKYDFRENNQEKLFIFSASNIYHFFIDTISNIVLFTKKFPNALVIIDYLDMANQKIIYEKVLTDYLEANNINYILIKDPYLLAINNFYYINVIDFSDFKMDLIYDTVKKYINNLDKKPTKKVYLSRRNVSKRIEDENILEAFFEECGFQIVTPEDFDDFQEQATFFNDVHTLVSATSAGIINGVFMQPGGTIIELIVPKPFGGDMPGLASIHSDHFLLMSFNKKHKYMGIRTPKKGSDIINYIKSDIALLDFIVKR